MGKEKIGGSESRNGRSFLLEDILLKLYNT